MNNIFPGSSLLTFNLYERRTININDSGFYSDETIFKGTKEEPEIVTGADDIDETIIGILKIQPEGVNLTNGDKIDIVCGNIRIDIYAYEKNRLNEINIKGSSTRADLSSLLNNDLANDAITGNGCVLQLVKVVR